MKETVLLFFLFFVCSVGPAKSAPTISDVSAEGQNVTVNGSGFGNHGLDIKWLGGLHGAIESMPQGERPSLGGWNFSSSTSITVASDQAHSGSQSIKSVLGNNQPGEAIISHAWSDRIHANQYIFSSWWVRRTHIGQCSWKMFQLNWQNATSRFDYPQLSMFIDPGNTARLLIRPGPDYANVSRDLSPPFPEQDDRWYRMDLNIHTSAVGSKNGTCTVSLHDPTGKTAIITKTLSDIMSFSDLQGYYQWFFWINNVVDDCSMQTVWLDDIYLQVGTHARVELGDHAEWNQCTFREIQRPSMWTGTKIQFEFNRGAFRDGDTPYLFVVDADGQISPGKAVTADETPADTLSIPKNIKVF